MKPDAAWNGREKKEKSPVLGGRSKVGTAPFNHEGKSAERPRPGKRGALRTRTGRGRTSAYVQEKGKDRPAPVQREKRASSA